MLPAGMKTWLCRMIPIIPTSELKGFCCNPQFTLILLHVDFKAFTCDCNMRFYLMPTTCIILPLWASPVKTTSWTIIYTKPQQAVVLLPLCSGKPRQHTGRNVICHQHLHSCFLWCCWSRGCTATMKTSGKAVFRQVFSGMIAVWLSWCSDGLSPSLASQEFLCFITWDSWALS